MADQFRLEAEELGKVARGLGDVESGLSAAVSGLRGQLGAAGTPWQFDGAPSGIDSNLEDVASSIDPSVTGAVAGLADYLQTIVNTFTESDA